MNSYLSLGSNLNDRKKQLRQAIELISTLDGVDLLCVSHFYETAPWGKTDQPDFINAAVKISTTLEPLELLDKLQAIENKLGRERHERWGERTIDIDILMIDDMIIDEERLQVPHPYMFERDFVSVPLSEIMDFQGDMYGDEVVKTDGCLVDFNLKLIACVDRNFGLGHEGELLFHIDEDMRLFRELTINHTVIMGRKTFKSIGKPLDNRRNIILSRTLDDIEGAEVVHNLEELYNILNTDSENYKSNSALVIGGGEVYRQLMPYAAEIYLTLVDETRAADTFFPAIDELFICDSSLEVSNGVEFRHYRRAFVEN